MLSPGRSRLSPLPRPPILLPDLGLPFRGPDDVLRRFRAGDRVVLDAVYRGYVGKVRTIIRAGLMSSGRARHSGSLEATAMDLVQEVFARAFAPSARTAFDGLREYGPYINAVARNVVIDWARREDREVPTDLTRMVELAGAEAEMRTRAGEVNEDPHLCTVVKRYLAGLDPTLRAVLDLRYRRGLSQQEGARAMGLSRQSLRTLEGRLQTGLRRALKRHELNGGWDRSS